MGTDFATQDAVAPPESAGQGEPERSRPRVEARLASVALSLVPGATVVYFGLNAGGYFAGTTAFAALLAAQLLIVRTLVAEQPYAGFTRALAVVGGLFTAFAAWTLASGLWSHAQARALIEFDRVFLYLLLLVLFGALARDRTRALWIVRGLVLGTLIVCGAGLISRVLPHVLPTAPNIANNRLSYPVTYWNALGIVAALGILLALGLTAHAGERRSIRVAAAVAVIPLAATLFFTFSRGSIVAVAIGVLGFALLAKLRNSLPSLVAVAPPTAVAVVFAYHANLLATENPTTPAAVSQGRHVAVAVAVCMVVAALLRLLAFTVEPRIRGISGPGLSRAQRIGVAGAAAVVVLVIAVAAGGPGWANRQYRTFVHGSATPTADLRSRLLDPSSNGRTDHWRVALAGFDRQQLHGNGAGTYEFSWNLRRHQVYPVADAHSLYLELLDETGIVGLVLVAVVILAILVALLRRARGPNRVLWASLFAAGLAWAIHAGIDWDWEMPVTSAWFFAVGGAALAGAAAARRPGRVERLRVPLAVGLLVACVTPVLLMLSQTHLARSTTAFNAGNCAVAQREALSSINWLAVRPEPYEILGYCDLRNGDVAEAIAAMQKAVGHERNNWQYHYDLAIAQAAAGRDPHGELNAAIALSPREQTLVAAVPDFAGRSPSAWERAAEKARKAAVSSGTVILK